MDVDKQANEGMEKVAQLVEEIKFAMLTTCEHGDTLHSRPMTTLQMDSDGYLWFFTSLDSHKVDDVSEQASVNLAYARPDKQDYLSVAGTAELVRDRKKMEELWTPWLQPWFRDGLDDPNLALLKVKLEEAYYWDAPGSAVKRLYGLAKGILTGKTDALGEHGRAHPPH
ncbi:pyridoxamine 5'-phosphate oxidase family protein [Noviherbaspirillum sp. UKPF54]|uniref:pyridoxamine 5'-phosphate oxidase family protein n=1 Tax=Noviherbaspirillum sp. UKPF54 TaxID=2601898 RepID=UPI0011B17398|nr:pyridoxamine 5'-phosphate oxidase family protein [Noviherbaspirillum sp. UKPF54]QDZ26815.1 general stress protein [Noviherbaspirillum sp. UKPF54]